MERATQILADADALTGALPRQAVVLFPLAHFTPEALRERLPALPLIALDAQPSVERATDAMRRGASDYLPMETTLELLAHCLERWQPSEQAASERAQPSEILTLLELGRTLTSTLELEQLYEEIIEQVERAFRPDTVSLMLLNPRTDRLRLVVQRGLPESAMPGTEVKVAESIAGRAVREGKPLLLLGGLQGTEFQGMARRNNIASAMSIPLQVKGKTTGVLNVNRYQGSPNYTEKDANLLHIFTAQIAIALQNAQLYDSLRDERDRIIRAQEDVRNELARDLHDGLAQVLASLAMTIDHLRTRLHSGQPAPQGIEEDLAYLRTTARQAIHDARTLNFGLRPLILETQGLEAALRQYIANVQGSDHRMTYHLESFSCDGQRLPSKTERMAFAILQEAIHNARKHARGKNVWVTLECGEVEGEPLLRAQVRDDGPGFDLPATEGNYNQRLSFGLHNMRERATLIEASYQMSSGPHGTRVELILPWHEETTPSADNTEA